MSEYPYERLRGVVAELQVRYPDATPSPVNSSKYHVPPFESRGIHLNEHDMLWISEECLQDEDDSENTVDNVLKALEQLDFLSHFDVFTQELLLVHRDQSIPALPAKIIGTWGVWKLIDPEPAVGRG